MGAFSGRDPKAVADEMGHLEEEIRAQSELFYESVRDLESHRAVADHLRHTLLKVRLSKLEQDLLESLLQPEVIADMAVRDRIELLKFASRVMPDKVEEAGAKEITDEEFEREALKLLEGGMP